VSYNGSGLFQINSSGQPVVGNTLIDATVFNALTTDLATGLTTCITKDGQTTVTANIPMSNFKFTGLAIGTSSTDSARVDNCNALNLCEFRLTLTTGVPVTTGDVTGAETLYMSPYKGNRIALYDGTNWVMRTTAEISIDVPDATNMYDVFAYDNAGTVTLELTAWTNETTRATALTTQNGVLVKTGALTRRYLGSFYSTTAGNGQIEDSFANRYLWNYYNRVRRPMRVLEATDSWNYSTATIRQANGSTANQLNFCVGVSEDIVAADLLCFATCSAVPANVSVGFGLDSTTAYVAGCLMPNSNVQVATYGVPLFGSWKGFPGVGKHYLAWLEYANTATTAWKGDSGAPTLQQSGIHGEIWG
jgi:hypothetical protein